MAKLEFAVGDFLRHLMTKEQVQVVAIEVHDGKEYYVLEKKIRTLPTQPDEVEGRFGKVEAGG